MPDNNDSGFKDFVPEGQNAGPITSHGFQDFVADPKAKEISPLQEEIQKSVSQKPEVKDGVRTTEEAERRSQQASAPNIYSCRHCEFKTQTKGVFEVHIIKDHQEVLNPKVEEPKEEPKKEEVKIEEPKEEPKKQVKK